MVWIRRLFWIAGIYGLLVVTPQYFLESRISQDQPRVVRGSPDPAREPTPGLPHPEYFYGFIGVVLVWQLVYITIGTDPQRYRPIILLAALAKFSFFATSAVLFTLGRIPAVICYFAGIDFVLGMLFVIAFVQVGRLEKAVASDRR